MRLADRQLVEGTQPPMYIGHRVWYAPATQRERVSKPWYAEWNEHGRKYAERLRTTNKQTAIRRAHQIAERIARGDLPEPAAITLQQVTTEYIGTLKGKGRAKGTIEKYGHVLNDLVSHAGKAKIVLARQFSETEFWRFSEHMIEQGLSKKTRHNYLIIIKQVFRWAAQNRKIGANPLAGVRIEEPGDVEQPVFMPEDVARILAEADPHERVVYAFLAYTGARFGEARDATWDDLRLKDGKHGFIVISRGGSGGTTKSGRSRRIPCHPALRAALDVLPRHPKSRRLFHARPSDKYPDGDGPIDERRMLRGLKRLCARLKLPQGTAYKLHSFRHFFASMLAAEQVSYKYALEFMGHTSSRVLDLYYKMFDPTAEVAILAVRVPPLPRRGHDQEGAAA